jgi:L-alanine-DL-glutamate epimerase-like enolase superfamily enzyme
VKIARVEVILLAPNHNRPMALVRVHTDEGLVGIGECSPMNAPTLLVLVEKALSPLVIGEDPFDIERLWQKMLLGAYKLGPMGAQIEAMAGIDIALWDIKGKALQVPVYQLLGGAVRREIRVYASFGRVPSPKDDARQADEHVKMGYDALKIHSATKWMFDIGYDATLESVKEIRAAVGDEVDLMVDVNNAYTVHHALQVGRKLEDYGVFHFEEPIAAYDYDGYAQLSAALDVPIAAGEQEYTRWQHRDLLSRGKIDILQPDVVKTGITELKKIVDLASAFNKPVTLHNVQPTVGTAATVHVAASTPGCLYAQEYGVAPHPAKEYLLRNPIEVRGGRIRVPEAPGLGIDIDEKGLKRLRDA